MKIIIEGWFWSMMQFFAVFGTLLLIYFQVRTQTASHIISTINSINSRWDSEAMLRARYFYSQNWLNGSRVFDAIAENIAEFLEEIGTVVRIRAVPKKVIWETHSWYIEHYYPMFQSGVLEHRKKYNDKALYSEMEWLYHEIIKINKRKQLPTNMRSEEEMQTFFKGEHQAARVALFLKEDGLNESNANKAN